MFDSSVEQLSGRSIVSIFICSAILIAAYALQIASPLRLNTDAVVLISVAEAAASGDGYTYHGEPTYYPYGYPALLALLIRNELATSGSIIAINELFIAIGIFALQFVLRVALKLSVGLTFWLCCMTLLSFVTVKHVTLALTDLAYFGISMGCLAVLAEAWRRTGRRRWLSIALASALFVVATLFRSIGICLLPALLWTALGSISRARFRKYVGLHTATAIVLIAVAFSGTILAFLVTQRGYLRQWRLTLDLHPGQQSSAKYIASQFAGHLRELGEIGVNAPYQKLPSQFLVTMLTGLAVTTLTLLALWKQRHSFGPVQIYLLSYIVVVFLWPYRDARFWLPTVPLLFGVVAKLYHAYSVRVTTLRWIATTYLLVFILLGIGALAYSTHLTFAGPDFPKLYGGGSEAIVYDVSAGGIGQECLSPAQLDAVHVLRRFGDAPNPVNTTLRLYVPRVPYTNRANTQAAGTVSSRK